MRTTLTLDDDVESALREAVYRSGKSFKHVVNEAVRAGLGGGGGAAARQASPYVHPTFSMGRPKVDLTKALSLAAELEDQEQAAKLARGA